MSALNDGKLESVNMLAGPSGAPPGKLYVADAYSNRYKKAEFAICNCGSGSYLVANPNPVVDIMQCPQCNKTYGDLELFYDAEIPKQVQAEKDEVVKHAAKHPKTLAVFSVDPKGFKPSVYDMFKGFIHPARSTDPSKWDLAVKDKHGVAILNDSIEQVMTEYNDNIYNHVTSSKTAFLDIIRNADPDDYIAKLIEQIKAHRDA